MLVYLVGVLSGASGQNQVVPSTPTTADVHETYRMRVENALYGRVEVSLDAGKNYILIGRVLRPATNVVPDRKAVQAGVILRGSSEGIAFAVSPQFELKIRPAPSQPIGTGSASLSAAAAAEIVTSISPDKPIFGKYLPPVGSQVMLQTLSHSPAPFPDGYSLSATDSFVVVADIAPPLPAGPPTQTDADRAIAFQHALRALFESMAADYRDGAIQRAVADKRKVAAGVLTLRPNLPPDEPDPITAITYAIDDGDNVVCARTTAPYLFAWDTNTVTDGEHVVEVRGLSANGNVITRTRYLVVINNHKSAK